MEIDKTKVEEGNDYKVMTKEEYEKLKAGDKKKNE